MRRGFFCFLICLCTAVSLFGQTVKVYQTTSDLSQALSPRPDLTFSANGSASQTITLDPTRTYQHIDGFGASFTDSSAWLVYKKLTPELRTDLMNKLFDRTNGIALSFLRQPMGASDLALNFYSYDDMPAGQTDPNLDHFSIAHDQEYIVPVLKQALSINPNIKMMANPWSPPAWMKTNNSLLGTVNGSAGYLKSDAFDPLAKYFVKYIQAYEAEGIPTHYISMQNEPQYAPDGYTGMMMSAQDQIKLLKNHIAPAFDGAGIKTKVMVWDHNWDNTNYPLTILGDASVRPYVAGVAWHHYAGTPASMSVVHDLYPEMGVWETEASGGTWQNNAFAEEASELIGSMRNWAKSYVLWNMVLDQHNGPVGKTSDGKHGCDTCRGVMTVNWQDGSPSTFKPELDYYILGHASKFVKPGAARIDSTQIVNGNVNIQDVAFRNCDGSIVLYVYNAGSADQTFNVKQGNNYFTATVTAKAVATFVWSPLQAPEVALEQLPNGLSFPSGQSSSMDLTVTPVTGTPTVTLGCQLLGSSGAVSGNYECVVGETPIVFADSTPQTTRIVVRPKGTGLASSAGRRFNLAGLNLLYGAPLLGIVFVGGSRKRRVFIAVALLCVVASSLIGCGGGGGGSTPPPVTRQTAPPTFNPSAGTIDEGASITIADFTSGATIYYTTDGTAPTTSSTKYTVPITVGSPKTLKAIATAPGYTDSVVATAPYTIGYTMVITATTDGGAPVTQTAPVLLK